MTTKHTLFSPEIRQCWYNDRNIKGQLKDLTELQKNDKYAHVYISSKKFSYKKSQKFTLEISLMWNKPKAAEINCVLHML